MKNQRMLNVKKWIIPKLTDICKLENKTNKKLQIRKKNIQIIPK